MQASLRPEVVGTSTPLTSQPAYTHSTLGGCSPVEVGLRTLAGAQQASLHTGVVGMSTPFPRKSTGVAGPPAYRSHGGHPGPGCQPWDPEGGAPADGLLTEKCGCQQAEVRSWVPKPYRPMRARSFAFPAQAPGCLPIIAVLAQRINICRV